MPDALLRALDITIGRRVDSLLAGDYRSTLHGDGTELAQVRPYVPGDDVRLIDWNVTARTQEPHGRGHLRRLESALAAAAAGSPWPARVAHGATGGGRRRR